MVDKCHLTYWISNAVALVYSQQILHGDPDQSQLHVGLGGDFLDVPESVDAGQDLQQGHKRRRGRECERTDLFWEAYLLRGQIPLGLNEMVFALGENRDVILLNDERVVA